jgi:hypothetical protein
MNYMDKDWIRQTCFVIKTCIIFNLIIRLIKLEFCNQIRLFSSQIRLKICYFKLFLFSDFFLYFHCYFRIPFPSPSYVSAYLNNYKLFSKEFYENIIQRFRVLSSPSHFFCLPDFLSISIIESRLRQWGYR